MAEKEGELRDYLMLMHSDAPDGGQPRPSAEWSEYFDALNAEHSFEGGSSIGGGVCLNHDHPPPSISGHIFGYIRIRARGLEHAETLAKRNPVYRAGGTVEIRELD